MLSGVNLQRIRLMVLLKRFFTRVLTVNWQYF